MNLEAFMEYLALLKEQPTFIQQGSGSEAIRGLQNLLAMEQRQEQQQELQQVMAMMSQGQQGASQGF